RQIPARAMLIGGIASGPAPASIRPLCYGSGCELRRRPASNSRHEPPGPGARIPNELTVHARRYQGEPTAGASAPARPDPDRKVARAALRRGPQGRSEPVGLEDLREGRAAGPVDLGTVPAAS